VRKLVEAQNVFKVEYVSCGSALSVMIFAGVECREVVVDLVDSSVSRSNLKANHPNLLNQQRDLAALP